MERDFWEAKWNNRDVPFNQQATNFLLERFWPHLKLATNTNVFVPLCGKSVDMIWLLSQGHKVVGVELSERACREFFEENQIPYQEAKSDAFIAFQAEDVTLYCGDFYKLTTSQVGSIDAVYDRAALIALPKHMRQTYKDKLLELADKDTQMLLITMSYDEQQMDGPPFSVDSAEVEALYRSAMDINRLYQQKDESLSPHLQKRGLKEATDHVFHLINRS